MMRRHTLVDFTLQTGVLGLMQSSTVIAKIMASSLPFRE